MTIYDEWYDAREVSSGIDESNATEHARAILAAIPDEEYLIGVTEGPEDEVSLQRSEPQDLEWFEVADVAAFVASDRAGSMTGTVVNMSCGVLVD